MPFKVRWELLSLCAATAMAHCEPDLVGGPDFAREMLAEFTGAKPTTVGGKIVTLRDRSVADRPNDHDNALEFLRERAETLGFATRVQVVESKAIVPLSDDESFFDIYARSYRARWISEGMCLRLGVRFRPLILKNLEVTVPGLRRELGTVVVGAHYDTRNSLGGDGWQGDTNAPCVASPGADDNVSGVVAAMSILNTLRKSPPNRTVKVVFFDGEEGRSHLINYKTMDGSRGWLNSLPRRDRRAIRAALVIDMIGSAPNNDQHLYNFSVAEKNADELIRKIRASGVRYPDINVLLHRPHQAGYAGRGSDGPSFGDRHIPNVTVTNAICFDDLPPHYHSEHDDIYKIDWVRYPRLTSWLTELTLALAN